MRHDEVTALYDATYAQQYDREFIHSPLNDYCVRYEVELLRAMIGPATRWADVGCGTGYYLGLFPQTVRAGMDLSPAMLDEARSRNAGVEFRQADFRDAVPEWEGRWSLVSCMWSAYSYVESVREVRRLFQNLVDWTAPGGALFVRVIDIDDLTNVDLPYRWPDVYDGELWITGVTWSWRDGFSDRLHEQLIAPHAAQIVDWLKPWYDGIRVVRYPRGPQFPMAHGNKGIVATGKRRVADAARPATIVWEPPWPPAAPAAPRDAPDPAMAVAVIPTTVIVSTLLRRVRTKRFFKRLLGLL